MPYQCQQLYSNTFLAAEQLLLEQSEQGTLFPPPPLQVPPLSSSLAGQNTNHVHNSSIFGLCGQYSVVAMPSFCSRQRTKYSNWLRMRICNLEKILSLIDQTLIIVPEPTVIKEFHSKEGAKKVMISC